MEKEKLVIKIANEGKTTREKAKDVHIPLRYIERILNKVTGDDAEEEKDQKLELKSDYAKAFQMFQEGLPLTDFAIELDFESPNRHFLLWGLSQIGKYEKSGNHIQ